MVTPQTWPLHGHNAIGQHFIGGSLVEVFQEASCWFAIQELEEALAINYSTYEDDDEETVHSLTVFYDQDR